MEEQDKKKIDKDVDGITTYEYIANHIMGINAEDLTFLIDNIIRVDKTGQFCVSTARYLHAIDNEKYHDQINTLVARAILVDREHKYICDLLASFWGEDYKEHVAELNAKDDNFRRIYKRVYGTESM